MGLGFVAVIMFYQSLSNWDTYTWGSIFVSCASAANNANVLYRISSKRVQATHHNCVKDYTHSYAFLVAVTTGVSLLVFYHTTKRIDPTKTLTRLGMHCLLALTHSLLIAAHEMFMLLHWSNVVVFCTCVLMVLREGFVVCSATNYTAPAVEISDYTTQCVVAAKLAKYTGRGKYL